MPYYYHLLFLYSIISCKAFKHRAPVFEFQSSTGEKYFGKIKENEVDVELSPEIRVLVGTGPICGYEFENIEKEQNETQVSSPSNNYSNPATPFDYRILNAITGQLQLRVKPGTFLDCSQAAFKFFMRAKRCDDGSLSDRALIEIRIEDTNNHEPEFEKSWYTVTVYPGLKSNESILQLKAYDKDCGHPYGEICRYEITNNANKWFHVTDSGLLRSTLPIDENMANIADSYLITVAAHDCGMRRSSSPTVITIKLGHGGPVRNSQTEAPSATNHQSASSPLGSLLQDKKDYCKPGLTNVAEEFEYFSGRGVLPLFPAAQLNVCPETGCPDDGTKSPLEAKISLNADFERNFDAKTCDRESLSLQLQKEICGADRDTIELLPSSKKVRIENEDNKNKKVEKREEEVYVFDGKANAVLVPDPIFGQNLSETFTLHFWMKRGKPAHHKSKNGNNHYEKENILCLSDDHRMNRHHLSVYAKNCKLEVLFRREKSHGTKRKQNSGAVHQKTKRSVKEEASLDNDVKKEDEEEQKFEPAEWRWHLDQTCDNNWHHYTLNVKFPEIELLVDGVPSAEVYEAPEILDDWPMHHVKSLKNRMVIGACWQGASGKMSQHFKGYLSALTLSPFKLEKTSTLQCLLQCKERLEFFGLDKLKAGEEAVFNRDMTELTLKAKNSRDFSEMLRKISYLNSRQNPTVGDRFVRVIATSRCASGTGFLPTLFPIIETRITVKNSPDTTQLLLKGSKLILTYSKDQVSQTGVPLFPDLKVYLIGTDGHDGSVMDQNLDYCKVESEPILDKSREFFTSPSSLAASLDFEQTKDGLLVKGRAGSKTYEKILQQIHYFNSRPDEFPRRVFTVFCSMYDGRLTSERFIITLNIESSKAPNIPAQQSEILIQQHDQDIEHKVVAKKEPTMASETIASTTTRHPEPAYAKIHKRHELLASEPKIFAMVNGRTSGLDGFDSLGGSQAAHGGLGGALAIIAVVCVGFFLLLGLVGLLKFRSTNGKRASKQTTNRRRRTSTNHKEEELCVGGAVGVKDLTWDDSGMTITINPIETSAAADPAVELDEREEDAYSDISTDDGSYHDEDCMSDDDDDEDGGQVLPHLESISQGANVHGRRRQSDVVGLEWEDDESAVGASRPPTTTTSSAAKTSPSSSGAYKV